MSEALGFIDFVRRSPTAFQAVGELSAMLEEAGYRQLQETERWEIVPGGKYYVTRNQSSVIAFRIPENGLSAFQIVASHSDSPTMKLKTAAESETLGHYVRLNVERYGGAILSTWFDKPLSIAGRALIRENGQLVTRLVDLGRDAVLIPNMPIHFNREVNDGYHFNPQTDMMPLYAGSTSPRTLKQEIAELLETAPDSIVASDLFLYNRTPGSIWGAANEFFSCPRIDDLECAYSSMQAFLHAGGNAHINVCAVFDNEEVGSTTKQGAASLFLNDVMSRCCYALGADEAETRAILSAGFMVSADNAHAVHPNHPDKYDADNRTWMNEGVVIKHNANQKYTTDAVSDAIFSEICRKAGAPVQHFSNRSDIPGGGTLGNIANTQVSMNTVDIGLAQLAMHSSYETAGTADIAIMIQALKGFYESDISTEADGRYTVR